MFGCPASSWQQDAGMSWSTPEQWGEPETGAARAAVSGLLGMMLAVDRVADAAFAAARGSAISSALAFHIDEGSAPAEIADIFSAGLGALRLLKTGPSFLDAGQLLRASVEVFVGLKWVGVGELTAIAHGLLRERWLDLCTNHRPMLSIPRLSVPAIEAAAGLTPTLSGIAHLVEAGRLASSLRLPDSISELLRSTLSSDRS